MTETATSAAATSTAAVDPKPTATPTSIQTSLDLSAETQGKAVPVFEGVWLIATRHRPGLSRHMFEIIHG